MLNVLSLFDGISCAQVSLNNIGLKINKYYASEIDKHAIAITQKNFPNTIQLGNVQEINSENLKNIEKIDIIFAGFPCQDISLAGKRKGLEGSRSGLFFEFYRIYDYLKNNNNKDILFLVENVGGIKKEDLLEINTLLKTESIFLDSALFSAQRRKRHYWTNIPIINELPNNKSYLKNILENKIVGNEYNIDDKLLFTYKNLKDGQYWKDLPDSHPEKQKIIELRKKHKNPGGQTGFWKIYDKNSKAPTLTAQGLKQKMTRFVLIDNFDIYRYPTPLECERLQTLPENYTDCISDNNRYKAIGNGWNVKTIEWILRNNF